MNIKAKFAAAISAATVVAVAFAPVAFADGQSSLEGSDVVQPTTEVSAPVTASPVSPSTLVNRTFTKGGCTYKVASISYKTWSTGKATVALIKCNSGKKSATVPNTVSGSFKFSADDKTAAASHTVNFTVTEIAANAFNNAKGHKITKVTIGANVKVIGNKAFKGCKKLKKIVVKGENILQVGSNKGSLKSKKLTKLKKKWKTCSAFKGVPRSCKVTVPMSAKKLKKLDFGYVENVRQLFGYAGFKGNVSW